MLKLPFFAVISLAFLIYLTNSSFSQNNLNIEKGKKYKFVLFDETEITGRVIDSDSSLIKVQQETNIVFIKAENILYISTDLTPSKYNMSISLLGGVNATTDDRSYYYGGSKNPGINGSVMAMFYISDTKAIKIDMSYTYFKQSTETPVPLYYTEYPTTYTGGELSHYTFKPNLILGSFNPADKFIAYGSLGIGINVTHRNERTERYYDWSDSVYRTYTSPSGSTTNALFSVGGGLGYRFTKNLGIHGEIEYNLVTSGDYYFIFGGRSYFPMRIGLTYYLF